MYSSYDLYYWKAKLHISDEIIIYVYIVIFIGSQGANNYE